MGQIGGNVFFHRQEILAGPDLHRADGKATEQRLLDAAVIPHVFAGQKIVAHALEVGVAEPSQGLFAFNFLKPQHIGVERTDGLCQGGAAIRTGLHGEVVVVALQGGVIDAVEKILDVVRGQSDCASGLGGRNWAAKQNVRRRLVSRRRLL